MGDSILAVEARAMRVAGVREIRENLAAVFGSDEPVLVTRHGKLSGLFVPLDDPDRIPDDLRRELARAVGRHLDSVLRARGVSEREVQKDFDAHRRRLR